MEDIYILFREMMCGNIGSLRYLPSQLGIPEVERVRMVKEVFSYERMKDKILCKLAGAEKCGQLSEDIVRISYLDVFVIFCVFPENKNRRKSAGFRITREMLRFWDVTPEEMMEDAFRNTRNRYHYFFRDLPGVTDAISRDPEGFLKNPLSVIREVQGASCDFGQVGAKEGGEHRAQSAFEKTDSDWQRGADAESGMYTLINQEFFNGAVILLFPDLLEEFARYVKGDLVILPSSVDELICLVRTEDMDYGRLRGIVRTVNDTCVSENEKLSDNLYLYLKGSKRVEILLEK